MPRGGQAMEKKGCHIRRRSHGKREDPITGPLISDAPTVTPACPPAKYSTPLMWWSTEEADVGPERHAGQAVGNVLRRTPWRCSGVSAAPDVTTCASPVFLNNKETHNELPLFHT